jgi:LCP family protein required for cell wall assembly
LRSSLPMNSPTEPSPPRRLSAAGASLAAALLPGSDQAIAGSWWAALVLLSPLLLLAAGLTVLILVAPSHAFLAGQLLQPTVLLVLLDLDLLLLAYRLAAGTWAWRAARRRSSRAASVLACALVLTLVVGPQAGAAALLWRTYDTVTTVFSAAPDLGDGSGGVAGPRPTDLPTLPPTPSPTPSASATPTPPPTPTPTPTPGWAARGRLNLLLVGGDAGPGRWSLRTDTMILLSVDVASGQAAMFGLPRNLINVPLPPAWANLWPCGCYPGLLNSLYVFASGDPAAFGGGANVGFKALETTVAYFTGVPIDGTAMVTLNGFVKLVDALGGLTIDIPAPLYDTQYPDESGAGDITISFSPGLQHLDGHLALAYARSRHQDSDYGRMARQQLVLRALRAQLDPTTLVSRIPQLLDLAKADSWTDLPVAQLPDLLALASRVNSGDIISRSFVPPDYPEVITLSETAAIRAAVVNVFVPPSPAPPSRAPSSPPAGSSPGVSPSASAASSIP